VGRQERDLEGLMDAASLYFGRRLMDLIREKQAEMTKPLLLGQAADYPDYRHRAGYLKGLADVVSWMEQISFEDEQKEIRA
jgi:hypothetical protein